jgi:hypothetical protein
MALEHDSANNRLYAYSYEGSVTEHNAESGEFLRRVVFENGSGEGILLIPDGRLHAGTLYVCSPGRFLAFDTDQPVELVFPMGQTWLPMSPLTERAQDILFARRHVTDATAGGPARLMSVRQRGRQVHISYGLPEPANVRLAAFDVAGRRVCVIDASLRSTGQQESVWNLDHGGSRIAAGVYFVELSALLSRRVAKVVVTR